jgi:hypothetical protein
MVLMESYEEKLSRAVEMAYAGPGSDLSPYDRAALQAVLGRLDHLERLHALRSEPVSQPVARIYGARTASAT